MACSNKIGSSIPTFDFYFLILLSVFSKLFLLNICLIYRHPLFPLLALLFERCEQATQSAETPNSESFNMDIQAFVQHQERDRKPFLINDAEVDGLVSIVSFS